MKRNRRGRHSTRSNGAPWLRIVGVLVLGIAATLASSTVEQEAVARYPDIQGCATGCSVAAAGWPLPYVIDYPGLSPARRASLSGAATGADRLRVEAFAIDLLGWTAVAFFLFMLLRRLRR